MFLVFYVVLLSRTVSMQIGLFTDVPSLESTPVYILPLNYIGNKKNHKQIQMNFVDSKRTISYHFGPRSTF
jgi:hypothetical protein